MFNRITRNLVTILASFIVLIGVIGIRPYSWFAMYQPKPPRQK